MKEKHYSAPTTEIVNCCNLCGQVLSASCGSYAKPETVRMDLNSASESGENVEFNAKSHHSSVWEDSEFDL